MMAAPLYDLTSLPSTLSTIPLTSPSASSSLPSSSSLTPLLASSPEAGEGGQQHPQEEGEQGNTNGSTNSKPPPSFLSLRALRPGIRGLRGVQGDQVTAFLHSPQEENLFCSPFRRRRRRPVEQEQGLTREEAWALYLAKLEEEANYFTVPETEQESQEEICTCPTCTASYEVLYGEYMVKAGKGREPPDKSTAAIMESILQVEAESRGCAIM